MIAAARRESPRERARAVLSLLRVDPVFRTGLALVLVSIPAAGAFYLWVAGDWHLTAGLMLFTAVWLLFFVATWLQSLRHPLKERCGELYLGLPLAPRRLWAVRWVAFAVSIALPLAVWLAFYAAISWPRLDERVAGWTLRVGFGLFFIVTVVQSQSLSENRVTGRISAPVAGAVGLVAVCMVFGLWANLAVLSIATGVVVIRSLRALPAAWTLAPSEPRAAEESRPGRSRWSQRWPVHGVLRRVFLPASTLRFYLIGGVVVSLISLPGVVRGLLLPLAVVIMWCVTMLFYNSLEGLKELSHLPVSRRQVFAYLALPGVVILAVAIGLGGRQTHDVRELCLQAIGVGVIWFLSMWITMIPVRTYGRSGQELRVNVVLTPVVLLPFLWAPVIVLAAVVRLVPELETAAQGGAERLIAWLPASPALAWALAAVLVAGLYLLAARRFERVDSFRVVFGPRSEVESSLASK